MPRGRPKKQPVEIELLPPDENDQIKVREVKHKTEWVELHPVEEAADGGEELDGDSIEDKPRRRVKDEHTKLRELLARNHIAPSAQLRLSIEKYLHSESMEGGTWAEKQSLTRYVCTKEQIINEDYLDVARKWGAGTYWFTLRMYTPGKNPGSLVVASWERRLGPAAPTIQHVNPNDPTSPQVIVQSTNGDGQQYQPPSMRDIMKAQKEAFKEQLEMAKLMREAYGMTPEQPQQQPRSEEEILSSAILKQPEVIETVVGSVIKRFGGKSGEDDAPWYADIVRKAVESGQAAQIVQVAIDRIFSGFSGLFPGGQNNGQAPIHQTPLQNQQTNQAPVSEGVPQIGESMVSSTVERSQGAGVGQDQTTTVVPQDPYTQMLTGVIATLINNGPVEEAIKRVDGFLLMAPQYTEAIDAQFSQPAENLLGAISTIPGCEQIAQAEHAKGWVESFQAKFFEESQEGEE